MPSIVLKWGRHLPDLAALARFIACQTLMVNPIPPRPSEARQSSHNTWVVTVNVQIEQSPEMPPTWQNLVRANSHSLLLATSTQCWANPGAGVTHYYCDGVEYLLVILISPQGPALGTQELSSGHSNSLLLIIGCKTAWKYLFIIYFGI